eukprot:262686-Chlamydomonas_euryale.AAC.5
MVWRRVVWHGVMKCGVMWFVGALNAFFCSLAGRVHGVGGCRVCAAWCAVDGWCGRGGLLSRDVCVNEAEYVAEGPHLVWVRPSMWIKGRILCGC